MTNNTQGVWTSTKVIVTATTGTIEETALTVKQEIRAYRLNSNVENVTAITNNIDQALDPVYADLEELEAKLAKDPNNKALQRKIKRREQLATILEEMPVQ